MTVKPTDGLNNQNPKVEQTYAEHIMEDLVELDLLSENIGKFDWPQRWDDTLEGLLSAHQISIFKAKLISQNIPEGEPITKYNLVLGWLNNQLSIDGTWVGGLFSKNLTLESIAVCVTYGGPTTYVEINNSPVVTVRSSGDPVVEARLENFSRTVWQIAESLAVAGR
jgi:hypothetical protein